MGQSTVKQGGRGGKQYVGLEFHANDDAAAYVLDCNSLEGARKLGRWTKVNVVLAEMQKVADTADISVLFFQLVLIFGPFWVIFGPFWQFWVIFGSIWAILGHFWAILGNFRSFLGHFFGANFFVAKYCSVLLKSLFATLLQTWSKSSSGCSSWRGTRPGWRSCCKHSVPPRRSWCSSSSSSSLASSSLHL